MRVAHHYSNTPHAYVWTISAQAWLPNRSQHRTELHNSVKHRPALPPQQLEVLLVALAKSQQLEHIWVALKSYATGLVPSMLMSCPPTRRVSQKPGMQHSGWAHTWLDQRWYLTCKHMVHADSAPASLPGGSPWGSALQRSTPTCRKEQECLSTC